MRTQAIALLVAVMYSVTDAHAHATTVKKKRVGETSSLVNSHPFNGDLNIN